jgi:hypothetical protein
LGDCVASVVNAGVVGVDAEFGNGGGLSGGNGGCHAVGVDIPSAVGLEWFIWRIRSCSSCSALKSDTNGLLST